MRHFTPAAHGELHLVAIFELDDLLHLETSPVLQVSSSDASLLRLLLLALSLAHCGLCADAATRRWRISRG
jgi:hypothetical protein